MSGTVRATDMESARRSANGCETVAEMEGLGLYQPEPMDPFLCDLCDTEPVTVDREWLGPGTWRYVKVCPDCDRAATTEMQTAFAYRDRDGWANRLTRIFAESEMSVESLERSLDRLYDLDEDRHHDTATARNRRWCRWG